MKATPLPPLLFFLLVVGCSNIGIEGQFVEPAEATATAQATSIQVTPTSTFDLTATAAIERAVRLTLTAAVPSSTDTPPPSATAEPTTAIPPTETPVPTATKKPVTQAPVMPTATAQPATQKATVAISVYCGRFGASPTYAEVDQPVVLTWGWVAVTEAYRQDYIDAASFAVQIDGQNTDISSATLTLSTQPNGFAARWSFPPRIFSPGTHQIIPSVTISRQITDGYDSNSDGNLDTYGPGIQTHPPCEIIVR